MLTKWFKDWIGSGLYDLWQWLLGTYFWIACIGGVIFIIFFAVTMDKKHINKATLLVVIYVILKGIDLAV